jgi:hypothetical protein
VSAEHERASEGAMEAARRFYWGGSIQSGLDSRTDAEEARRASVKNYVADLARFGEEFAASQVRAAVERCCAAVCLWCSVRDAVSHGSLCGRLGYVHTLKSGARRFCAASEIRAAFAANPKEGT